MQNAQLKQEAAAKFHINVYRAMALMATWQFLVILPVTVPLFTQRGLGIQQFYLTQALHAGVVLLLNVPTSLLAARLGKRAIFLAAGVCRGLGAVLVARAITLSDFLVAYVAIGMGNSLFSGLDISLLYDGNAKNLSMGRRFLTLSFWLNQTALVGAILLGGLLAGQSVESVATLNAITSWLPFCCVLAIPGRAWRQLAKVREPARIPPSPDGGGGAVAIPKLLLLAMLVSGVATFNMYYCQYLFASFGRSIVSYALALGAIQSGVAIVNYRMKGRFVRQIEWVGLGVLGAILAGFFCYRVPSLVVFFVGMALIEGARAVNNAMVVNYLNYYSRLGRRALVNSLIQSGGMLTFLVISLTLATRVERPDPRQWMSVMIGAAIVITGTFGIWLVGSRLQTQFKRSST